MPQQKTIGKPAAKIWRYLPLLVIGLTLSYNLYRLINIYHLLDPLHFTTMAVIGLGHWCWVIAQDYRECTQTRKASSFLPTALGLLLLLLNLGQYRYQHNKKYQPAFIQATYDAHNKGLVLFFRANGTYMSASGDGQKILYRYGNYTLTDTLIVLKQAVKDNFLLSDSLIIRTEDYTEYVIQVNGKKEEITPEYRLSISKK